MRRWIRLAIAGVAVTACVQSRPSSPRVADALATLVGRWTICFRADSTPPLAGGVNAPDACGELVVSARRVAVPYVGGTLPALAAAHTVDFAPLLGSTLAGRERCAIVYVSATSKVVVHLSPLGCFEHTVDHDGSVFGTGLLRPDSVAGEWAAQKCEGCVPSRVVGHFWMRRSVGG